MLKRRLSQKLIGFAAIEKSNSLVVERGNLEELDAPVSLKEQSWMERRTVLRQELAAKLRDVAHIRDEMLRGVSDKLRWRYAVLRDDVDNTEQRVQVPCTGVGRAGSEPHEWDCGMSRAGSEPHEWDCGMSRAGSEPHAPEAT